MVDTFYSNPMEVLQITENFLPRLFSEPEQLVASLSSRRSGYVPTPDTASTVPK